MAGPIHNTAPNLMEARDIVAPADSAAMTRVKRDISPGLPAGKRKKAELPQTIPEIRIKMRQIFLQRFPANCPSRILRNLLLKTNIPTPTGKIITSHVTIFV
jgi:hypothetical protein